MRRRKPEEMPITIPDDPTVWFSIGAFVLGIASKLGFDRTFEKGSTSIEKELVDAVREVSHTVSTEHNKTRDSLTQTSAKTQEAIHISASKTQSAIAILAESHARLDGRLSGLRRADGNL